MTVPATAPAAMLFLELQPEIVASSVTVPPDMLRRTISIACGAGKALDLPVFASIVPLSANTRLAAIAEVAHLDPIIRTTISALDDETVRSRVIASGAERLAVGGVSSEIAILHTALSARRNGYEVDVLVDCCGGLSDRTEQSAFQQLQQAGCRLSNLSSFLTSLVSDLADARGQSVMQSIGRLWGWDAASD